MKGIITILCMCIIPMIGITQRENKTDIIINSNHNYTKIEKKVHNRWTVLSSKYESNRFTINTDTVTWIGKTKIKTYTVTQHWIFEGKPTYAVKDSMGEIMVFQIIPNRQLQLLWLDAYSRRMAIVFNILKN